MKYGEVLLIFTENVKLRQLKSFEIKQTQVYLGIVGFWFNRIEPQRTKRKAGESGDGGSFSPPLALRLRLQ